jgi:hypothetical protein
MSDNGTARDSDVTVYFDAALAGRRVQADGGADISDYAGGDRVSKASRESYEGTLTGKRLDQGDPPWRWVEIGNLTEKPDTFDRESVWCEESYVYFLEK